MSGNGSAFVEVLVPQQPTTDPTPTVGTPTPPKPIPSLPVTGTDLILLLAVGLVLTLVGFLLLVSGRATLRTNTTKIAPAQPLQADPVLETPHA